MIVDRLYVTERSDAGLADVDAATWRRQRRGSFGNTYLVGRSQPAQRPPGFLLRCQARPARNPALEPHLAPDLRRPMSSATTRPSMRQGGSMSSAATTIRRLHPGLVAVAYEPDGEIGLEPALRSTKAWGTPVGEDVVDRHIRTVVRGGVGTQQPSSCATGPMARSSTCRSSTMAAPRWPILEVCGGRPGWGTLSRGQPGSSRGGLRRQRSSVVTRRRAWPGRRSGGGRAINRSTDIARGRTARLYVTGLVGDSSCLMVFSARRGSRGERVRGRFGLNRGFPCTSAWPWIASVASTSAANAIHRQSICPTWRSGSSTQPATPVHRRIIDHGELLYDDAMAIAVAAPGPSPSAEPSRERRHLAALTVLLQQFDADGDGDGFTSANDCDDLAATVHPGAAEIPNDGIDQDCSGADLVAAYTVTVRSRPATVPEPSPRTLAAFPSRIPRQPREHPPKSSAGPG